MRIKKRIISLMLALVLCCTMALPAFASVTPKADVSIEEMFNEAVLTASTKLSGRGADNASCYVTLTSDDGSAFDVAVYLSLRRVRSILRGSALRWKVETS